MMMEEKLQDCWAQVPHHMLHHITLLLALKKTPAVKPFLWLIALVQISNGEIKFESIATQPHNLLISVYNWTQNCGLLTNVFYYALNISKVFNHHF